MGNLLPMVQARPRGRTTLTKNRIIFLMLLLAAVLFQYFCYWTMSRFTAQSNDAVTILATICPGGLGWFMAFAYAFRTRLLP